MLRSCLVLACGVMLCLGYGTIQCGFNEEMQCVYSCPPERTCRNKDIQFDCLLVDENVQCTHKCVCKDGYARNSLGDCISYKQCDLCRGQNEFYACNSACDNVCSLLHKQNRTNCPIQNIVCNPGCYCDDGYARDAHRNCIPQDKCPLISNPPACAIN